MLLEANIGLCSIWNVGKHSRTTTLSESQINSLRFIFCFVSNMLGHGKRIKW